MFEDIIDSLIRNKDRSQAKSYLIGFERGQIWATDFADSIQVRQWSEENHIEFEDLVLPDDEVDEYHMLNSLSPLEWQDYLKGWLEGVRDMRR